MEISGLNSQNEHISYLTFKSGYIILVKYFCDVFFRGLIHGR